jgi:CheY-like chemotaxis protein
VLDDDAALRCLVALALRPEGYTVDEAGDRFEGLEHLRPRSLQQLVVLDVRMPVLGGIGFLIQPRQPLGGSEIPIVIVSATSELPKGTAHLGVKALLAKPFDPDLLLAVVDRLIRPGPHRIPHTAHMSTLAAAS